jgi:hypothetical protein
VADSLLVEAAVVLNCKIGHLRFVYLGIPIGGIPRQLSFWQSLVENIRKKLSRWKATIYLWVVGSCTLNLYCLRFPFIFFPSSSSLHVLFISLNPSLIFFSVRVCGFLY